VVEQRGHDGGAVERVGALDGVRGVAVGMVLLYHGGQPALGGFLLQSGVDLFFVLSGFLITTILLRTRDRSDYFRLFYGRRAVRIFPLYYLVLAVFVLGATIAVDQGIQDRVGFPEAQSLVDNQWWGWLYQVNNLEAFQGESAFAGLAHLWSLAIEEQFYLVWPMVVLLCPRRYLLRVCLAVALVSALVRAVGYGTIGEDFAYYFTFSRLDGLALGAAGAVVVASPELLARCRPAVAWLGRRWWLVLVLILMPLPVALWGGILVLSVAYLGVVLAARDGLLAPRPAGWLHSRFLLQLGKYSYAIYVVSVPIAQNVERIKPTGVDLLDAVFQILVVGGVSYGLARLSWLLWEQPWLRLKRRLSYT
jgi:peptidoglycan/LPS O-acetylase OafA/YrhL